VANVKINKEKVVLAGVFYLESAKEQIARAPMLRYSKASILGFPVVAQAGHGAVAEDGGVDMYILDCAEHLHVVCVAVAGEDIFRRYGCVGEVDDAMCNLGNQGHFGLDVDADACARDRLLAPAKFALPIFENDS
jgi:hypothetical protein